LIGVLSFYEVKKGDNLYKIARIYDVTPNHIKRANKLNRNKLKTGEKLIIPSQRISPKKSADGIVLNIPELTIYYYENKKIKFFSPTTCGRLSMKTPLGKYKIVTKKLNPTWYPPVWTGLEKPVPPGPQNPLGDRWMGLSINGYGIHSTNSPRSIGKIVSHGCIRMYPEDAEKLFNSVKIGTPVEIIYQPVKFGYHRGKIYLEVHPDLYYYGTNNFQKVWKMLEDKKIVEVVSSEKIKEILREARGIPIPIVGSDFKIFLLEKEINFLISPIIINNICFVELEALLKEMNCEFFYDEIYGRLKLTRGLNILEFSLPDRKIYFNGEEIEGVIPWYIVFDKIFVPLRFVAEIFGYEIKQLNNSFILVPSQILDIKDIQNFKTLLKFYTISFG
jgi:L,D-transpeptidase ErfK/SrfK